MSYSEADLAKLLNSNPDLVLVTDGDYTTLQPAAKPVQVPQLTEHDLQAAIVAKCAERAKHDPTYARIFAVPNGGHRDVRVARKLKAEGVRAGVPDLLLLAPRHGYMGLIMELKVGKNRPSRLQTEWMEWLASEGYYTCVVYDDPGAAMDILRWYIEGVGWFIAHP